MARMKQKSVVHFHMAVVLSEKAKRIEASLAAATGQTIALDAKGMLYPMEPKEPPQAGTPDQKAPRPRSKWGFFGHRNKQDESDSEETESRGIVPSLTYSHFIAQQTLAREKKERERGEAEAKKRLLSQASRLLATKDAKTDIDWEQMQEELAELIANAAIDAVDHGQPPAARSATKRSSFNAQTVSTATTTNSVERNESWDFLSRYLLKGMDPTNPPSFKKQSVVIPHKIQTRISAAESDGSNNSTNQYENKSTPIFPATTEFETPPSETAGTSAATTPRIISAADTIQTAPNYNNPDPVLTPRPSNAPAPTTPKNTSTQAGIPLTHPATTATSTLRRSSSLSAISAARVTCSNPVATTLPPPKTPSTFFLQQPQPITTTTTTTMTHFSHPQSFQPMVLPTEQQPSSYFLYKPQQHGSDQQGTTHTHHLYPSFAIAGRNDSLSKSIYSSHQQHQQPQHQQQQIVEYEVVDIGFGSAVAAAAAAKPAKPSGLSGGGGGGGGGPVNGTSKNPLKKKASLVSNLRKGFW
ncbi:hypothetical protein HDU81_002138 [Chytriomyces hyalinus]|nr:hypothetical protein HDU81_002138 [Chytriomyces hyalinus]